MRPSDTRLRKALGRAPMPRAARGSVDSMPGFRIARPLVAAALLLGCTGSNAPASHDAVQVELPAPARRANADSTAGRAEHDGLAPPERRATSADRDPDLLAEPPITRTLSRPPILASAAPPAPPRPVHPAVASATTADKAAARQLFSEGVAALEQGDLHKARASFERAYQLVPMYRVLYNIAQTARQQKDRAGMCSAFKAYLREASPEEAKLRESEFRSDCP